MTIFGFIKNKIKNNYILDSDPADDQLPPEGSNKAVLYLKDNDLYYANKDKGNENGIFLLSGTINDGEVTNE